MRNLKTIAIVLGIYAAAIVMEVAIAFSSSEYEGGIGALLILVLLGFMASKVGYRWFDCFFAVIPIYGIFFIFRVANRIANLPEIDWPQRTN